MENDERKKRLAMRLAEARALRQELQMQFRDRTITLLSTALGVVAALFWQTAITDTIKAFIPVSGAWGYELVVAVIVTVLAVVVLFLLSHATPKKEEPPVVKPA